MHAHTHIHYFVCLWLCISGTINLLLLFSCWIMSNSLHPHGWHDTLLCPPLSPWVCSNSCPVMLSIHLILCCPFSLKLQCFPASGTFSMSQHFASGGQSIGDSASASVLPVTIQGWFPLELTGLISLQSKELSGAFSSTTIQKHQFFCIQPCLWSKFHIHTWLLEKP